MLSNNSPVTIIISSRCYSTLTSLFLRVSHINKLLICTGSICRYKLLFLDLSSRDGLQRCCLNSTLFPGWLELGFLKVIRVGAQGDHTHLVGNGRVCSNDVGAQT